jgi:hypothetical protein
VAEAPRHDSSAASSDSELVTNSPVMAPTTIHKTSLLCVGDLRPVRQELALSMSRLRWHVGSLQGKSTNALMCGLQPVRTRRCLARGYLLSHTVIDVVMGGGAGMASEPALPDFSAPDTPLAVKVTTAANMVSWFLFANPIAVGFWGLVGLFVWTFVFTRPLREGNNFWFAVISVVVCIGIFVVLALLIERLISNRRWYSWLIQGKPRFWPIQSIGRRKLDTISACIRTTKIDWKPDDRVVIEKLAELNEEFYRELLHRYYIEHYEDKDWPRTWKTMQAAESHHVTFGEALRSGLFDLFALRLGVVQKYVYPFSTVFCIGYVWLLGDVIRGASPLRLVQFTLLTGFITAAVVFVNFVVQLRVITVQSQEVVFSIFEQELKKTRETDSILTAWMDEFREKVRALEETEEGKVLFPTITILPGYVEALRNSFVREFTIGGLMNAVLFLPVLLLVWPIALFVSSWKTAEVHDWTIGLGLGLVVGSVAFSASVAIAFFVLAKSHAFIGLIFTGVFLAIVPPLVSYSFGGDIGSNVVITSVLTGAAGIVSSAIAELVKKRPSAELATG